MADEIAPASPGAAATAAGSGDGTKSGNLSVDQVAHRLVARNRAEVLARLNPPKPAGEVAPPAQAEESTPATREAPASPLEGTADTPPPQDQAPAQPQDQARQRQEEVEPLSQPDLSQLSDLDPKTQERVRALLDQARKADQEKIDRRIGKEVARRKELEEQIAGNRQQPNPLTSPFQVQPQQQAPVYQPQQAAQPPAGPVSQADTVEALQAEARQARLVYKAVDDAIAIGPSADGKYNINGQDYTKQEVISIRRGASEAMEVAIPSRMNFLQQRHQALQLAYQTFPWLKDRSTPEFQNAMAIINANAWLRDRPDMEYTVGMYVEGMKAVTSRAAPQQAQTPPRQRPPGDQTAQGGGGAAPTRTADSELKRQAMATEMGKLRKKGGLSQRELAQALAQREQLSQSR